MCTKETLMQQDAEKQIIVHGDTLKFQMHAKEQFPTDVFVFYIVM
jgi:hypothetical protein